MDGHKYTSTQARQETKRTMRDDLLLKTYHFPGWAISTNGPKPHWNQKLASNQQLLTIWTALFLFPNHKWKRSYASAWGTKRAPFGIRTTGNNKEQKYSLIFQASEPLGTPMHRPSLVQLRRPTFLWGFWNKAEEQVPEPRGNLQCPGRH